MHSTKSTKQVILDFLGQEPSLSGSNIVEKVLSDDPSQTQAEVLNSLEELHKEGKVSLRPPRFASFKNFLLGWELDFWTVLVICGVYLVLARIASASPWSIAWLPLGLVLLFYFPGHSVFRAFFGKQRLPSVERLLLEVGTSIVLVMLLGLLLNFTPAGLFSGKAQWGLAGFNLELAVLGSFLEYRVGNSAGHG